MNTSPLVSVLITAFNRERYIAEAIESVLASHFTNFELIIVDDSSIDETYEIAMQYLKKDTRIRLFRNDKNLGQFGNRNKAASLAKGSLLKYLDSDDKIYPDTLGKMVGAMQTFPEAALGFCVTTMPFPEELPLEIQPENSLIRHYLKGGLLFVGPSGLIIKRNAFVEVKGFEEYGMPSDNHLTLKIASKYPVIAMENDLFYWRIHDEQVFSQNLNNYSNIINNYRINLDIILNHSTLKSNDKKVIIRNQKRILFSNLTKLALIKGKPLKALKLLIELA